MEENSTNKEKKLQIIFGGTSGLGLATAIALGKQGPVLVSGRNQERLDKAIEELKKAKVEGYGKTCDISDRKAVEELFKFAKNIAPIGNVINAAGISKGDIELIWKINVQGTINVVEAFLPYINNSCLVNFSSMVAYFYQPNQEEIEIWQKPNSADFFEKSLNITKTKKIDERTAFLGPQFLTYMASKKFVQYYTAANALRFGKKNSQIFSVAPGSFETPMMEVGDEKVIEGIKKGTVFNRLGKPEEMANFIAKLLEPGHEYLTGVDLILDGGKYAMKSIKQYE